MDIRPDPHFYRFGPTPERLRCIDCEQYRTYADVWLICSPNGLRQIICEDCVDPAWMAAARDAGRI